MRKFVRLLLMIGLVSVPLVAQPALRRRRTTRC